MEKNKTEIIAQIVTLLSQLVENEDNMKNESAAVSAAAPVEMLTIKKCAEAVSFSWGKETFDKVPFPQTPIPKTFTRTPLFQRRLFFKTSKMQDFR